MKKTLAAFLIAIVCLSVLGAHAWKTWGEVDRLPASPLVDKELFEYSLFLESFAFMVSAAYLAGPKIYRFFGEEAAAAKFEGEKQRVSRTVHIYSAVCVMARRIGLDSAMSVPLAETIAAIALISTPALWAFLRRKQASHRKIPGQPPEPTR